MVPVNKISTEFKSIDKGDRVYFIGDQINDFSKDYIHNMTRNKVIAEKYQSFFADKKVAKALNKVMKMDEFKISPLVVVLLTDTLKVKGKEIDDSVTSMYLEIISDIFNKRAKKLSKKTDIDRTTIINLLMEYPVPGKEANKCNYTLINRLIKKIYLLDGIEDKLTPDNVHILLNAIMGRDIYRLVFNILLERKENANQLNEKQIEIWNKLTTFALETLNDLGKKSEVAEAIDELYISKRKKDAKRNNDYERRLHLYELSEDRYPKIVKACHLLIEKDENNKKFL